MTDPFMWSAILREVTVLRIAIQQENIGVEYTYEILGQ